MEFTCEHCGKEIGCINVIHKKKFIHYVCLDAYIEYLGDLEMVDEDIAIEEFGRCTLTHISNHEKQENN